MEREKPGVSLRNHREIHGQPKSKPADMQRVSPFLTIHTPQSMFRVQPKASPRKRARFFGLLTQCDNVNRVNVMNDIGDTKSSLIRPATRIGQRTRLPEE